MSIVMISARNNSIKSFNSASSKISSLDSNSRSKFKGQLGTKESQFEHVDELARVLSKQIDSEIFERKCAPAKEVLTLVGAGAFLVASVAMPNLPRALRPFLRDGEEYNSWRRFNIPYLKRTLRRLERQKLVKVGHKDGQQVVKITENGRTRVLRYALDELEIKKPRYWDGKWYLVSYDIPEDLRTKREYLVSYLKAWGFYPLHLSVYLHAYPEAIKAVDFLRSYLRVGEYVRVFRVSNIENDAQFKEFFGV